MIELSLAKLVVPALLDGVGIGIGRRPIIDPLLQDRRLVPLFRDRAIGQAAALLQRPASRSAGRVTPRAGRASPVAARRQGRREDRENDPPRPSTRLASRTDSMRRFLRALFIIVIGIAIAIAALIWEGTTLESMLYVGDVPVIDFATVQRGPDPNQYLLCPKGMCTAETDGEAPVFDVPVEQLRVAWDEMLAEQPRLEVLRRDVTNTQIDYVQRTRLLRFPDLVTVRFVPVDDTHSTLAIFSRSVWGKGDMGVNRKRVEEWLARLQAKIG
jgi:uncharacterized protein (DUF1499 family)